MTPILLRTSTATLEIRPNEHAWSDVQLTTAGMSRPLGAETLKYLTTHIRAFLSDPAPGQRWVLSLSELHVSVYGEHLAEGVVLHFQDAHAKMFADVVITDAEKTQWIQELTP
jgi:hypothetical protein